MGKAMKISSQQVRAALAAYVTGRAKHAAAKTVGRPAGESPQSVSGLEHRLANLPDERDTIVHELRRKIRRGRYFVSSRDIVNALLGRLTADLLNED
jgi:anti-sigma28 factor (negative regulator of flagellin synthesis)